MADTLGVTAAPFDTMFNERALEMKRLVMNYVKNLQGMLQVAPGIPGSAPTATTRKAVLHNGFPRLPPPFDVNQYSKKELEDLYRDYIGSHYCTWFHLDTSRTADVRLGVATRHRTRQAPWSRMKEDTLKYVDAEHLPRPDFVLDNPRAMKLEFLREFFAHIAEREETFELGDVIRFKYADATRKGSREGDEDEEHGIWNEDSGAEHGEGSGDAEQDGGAGGAGRPVANSGNSHNANQEHYPHRTGETPPPALPPNPNPAKIKKTKKTPKVTAPTKQPKSNKNSAVPDGTHSNEPPPAPPTKNKKPKKAPNQPTSAHLPGNAVGAERPPRPHPKPRPVTHPTTSRLGEVTSNQATGTTQPTSAHLPSNAVGAERPPRPKPHPVTRPTTSRLGEGTSNQAPGTDDNPQSPTQPQGGVPDAMIDPSLLVASNQPPCALVNTSDNLALQEASRFAVKGKRVPKKKQQV